MKITFFNLFVSGQTASVSVTCKYRNGNWVALEKSGTVRKTVWGPVIDWNPSTFSQLAQGRTRVSCADMNVIDKRANRELPDALDR